jgi:hypothetical protein
MLRWIPRPGGIVAHVVIAGEEANWRRPWIAHVARAASNWVASLAASKVVLR